MWNEGGMNSLLVWDLKMKDEDGDDDLDLDLQTRMIPPLDLELKYHKNQVRRWSTKYTHKGVYFGQEMKKKRWLKTCSRHLHERKLDQDEPRTSFIC